MPSLRRYVALLDIGLVLREALVELRNNLSAVLLVVVSQCNRALHDVRHRAVYKHYLYVQVDIAEEGLIAD